MTFQQPVYDVSKEEEAAAMMAVAHTLATAVDIAESIPTGKQRLGEALCAALDTVAGGAPDYDLWSDMRSEASWWADVATPLELEAYIAAGLQRVERTTFAQRARKRLFMTLWRSFTPRERSDFTAWIMTKGAEE